MTIWNTGQNKGVCISIVRKYLKWVVKYYPTADEVFICELLRYSLCKLLNLETVGASRVIEEMSLSCVEYLKNDIRKSGILTKGIEARQGFLEVCIHCIEFTRKRCSD